MSVMTVITHLRHGCSTKRNLIRSVPESLAALINTETSQHMRKWTRLFVFKDEQRPIIGTRE